MKYPRELTKCGRSGLVLSSVSKFDPLDTNDYENGVSPLGLKPWSSLSLEFANSDKNFGGSGCIEATRIADAKIRTRYAIGKIMESEASKKASTDSENVKKIRAAAQSEIKYAPGKLTPFKGKSVQEFVNTATPDQVLEMVTFLKNSSDGRYQKVNSEKARAIEILSIVATAKNTAIAEGVIADVIFDKVASVSAGKRLCESNDPMRVAYAQAYQLSKTEYGALFSASEDSKGYVIYPMVLKTPNTKKIDADGMTKAYELSVTCYPDRTAYPFTIYLRTMRGYPAQGKEVGITGAKDFHEFSIDLASWEWTNIIETASNEKSMVEMMQHTTAYQAVLKYEGQNRAASGLKNHPQTQQPMPQPQCQQPVQQTMPQYQQTQYQQPAQQYQQTQYQQPVQQYQQTQPIPQFTQQNY